MLNTPVDRIRCSLVALPAAIEVAQERIVEASLGADSIQHGMQAAAVGLTAVVLAMLIYYRRAPTQLLPWC